MRAFDSVLLADSSAWAAISVPSVHDAAARSDAAMLWIASRDAIDPAGSAPETVAVPGGAMLCSLADGADCVPDAEGIVLILRERSALVIAASRTARVLPESTALRALATLAGALLASDARLSAGQERLVGRAIAELVAAALLPVAPAVPDRRQASLLDRVVTHIDRHFAAEIDAPTLCRALNCSRSALYRAVRPVGGVVALVKQRRLAAVYDRLRDPAERAGVGDIARANGFADPAQFSRSFKLRYGRTAGAVRAAQRPTA